MHNKKKHTTAAAPLEPDTDKLALVKAAAWAWHQHSSSSSKNKQAPPPEFPLASTRRRSSHRPSRYRLESLSKSNPTGSPEHLVPEKMAPITLLDFYEIERITRELERLVAVNYDKREKVQRKKVQMRKSTGGGCLFGKHAVMICGSPDTAAETEALVGRRRERSTEILHSLSL